MMTAAADQSLGRQRLSGLITIDILLRLSELFTYLGDDAPYLLELISPGDRLIFIGATHFDPLPFLPIFWSERTAKRGG